MKFIKLTMSILLTISLVLGFVACKEKNVGDEEKKAGDEKEEKAEGKGAEGGDESAAAKEDKGDKPPVGTVVLEEVKVEGLGDIMLPKGYKETTPATKKNGHYKLALSEDGMKSLYVDWESAGGATTLKEGDKLIGILIGNGKVKEKKDLGNGRVKYVASRESDGMTWTVVFNKNSYLKCWGPADQAENCSKIAESLDSVAAE